MDHQEKSIEQIREQIAENDKNFLQERRFKLNRELNIDTFRDITDFLDWFLNNEQGNTHTECIWEDVPIGKVKEREDIQCISGRNRSTHDIFLLCKYYFPEITLEEVIYTLVDLNENLKISTLQCPHISARVWYANSRNSSRKGVVISEYDEMTTDNSRLHTLTNGLDYLHLKELYEHTNKEQLIEA